MATLSAAIVKHKVASMSEVEEALARQVLYGGDLVTNLLEAAAVNEEQLVVVLGHNQELGPAPPGPLPRVNSTTLGLVPSDLATRHSVYPLAERPGELVLAVSDPLPAEVENDLAFALGVNITQLAAPLVRVRQAIARDYGAPLDRRFERLLAKLDGHAPPPASGSAERQGSAPRLRLPRPESLPPAAYPPNVELPNRSAADISSSIDTALLRAPRAQNESAAPAPEGAPVSQPEGAQPAFEPEGTQPAFEPEGAQPAFEPEGAPVPQLESAPSAPSTEGPPLAAHPVPQRPEPIEDPQPQTESPAVIEESSDSEQPSPNQPLAAIAKSSLLPPGQHPSGRVRRGPYTAAMAKEDLQAADSRDEVMRSFFDFAAQYFEYSALFAVHSDLAEGWDSQGPGADRQAISRVGVPLDLPSSLARAREGEGAQLVQLEKSGIDADLRRDLKRDAEHQVVLLPVTVRGRCVLLLYGDHGAENVALAAIGDVIAIAALVSAALERVILQRKLAARRAVAVRDALDSMPPVSSQRRHEPLPTAEQRARALAQALAAKDRKGPGTHEPVRAPVQHEPSRREPTIHDAPTPAVLPQVRASWTTPVSDKGGESDQAPLTETSDREPNQGVDSPGPAIPGIIPPEAQYEPVIPLTRRTSRPPPRGAPTIRGLAPRRETTQGLAPPPPRPRSSSTEETSEPARDASHSSPEIAIETTEVGEEWLIEEEELGEDRAPLAPASRSVAHEARAPQRRHSSKELNLPSVIVDTESDVQMLTQKLLEGDDAVAQQLVRLGEAAIAPLVAVFPGPITADPRQTETAQPSRCGPVLDVLARIGRTVEPYLLIRTADSDAHVRAWAVRLLGEVRGTESARAIAKRMTDEDEGVRNAALSAARMIQKDAQSRKSLRDALVKSANDEELPTPIRLTMVGAIASIRDQRAVPMLIPLLTDPNGEVVKATEDALCILSRQQFGADIGRWTEWWDAHGKRHRIEWLIDSLVHEDQDIRAAAGEELKTITKEYFGYYDDLPRKERARAQQRYREWWESRGRAIFT